MINVNWGFFVLFYRNSNFPYKIKSIQSKDVSVTNFKCQFSTAKSIWVNLFFQ